MGMDEAIRFWGRICVPDLPGLRDEILKKALCSPYAARPGGTKVYRDLRQTFGWPTMKKDVMRFVAHCQVYQQVIAEHQRSAGNFQPLPVPG